MRLPDSTTTFIYNTELKMEHYHITIIIIIIVLIFNNENNKIYHQYPNLDLYLPCKPSSSQQLTSCMVDNSVAFLSLIISFRRAYATMMDEVRENSTQKDCHISLSINRFSCYIPQEKKNIQGFYNLQTLFEGLYLQNINTQLRVFCYDIFSLSCLTNRLTLKLLIR